LTNGLLGLAIGLVYAGALENFSLVNLPLILLSLLLGCFINFFIYLTLALTAFWFEENTSFFWIYQKLVFTLGGMLLPIDLFPKWLQSLSHYLPFAYVTYAPAKLAVDFSLSDFCRLFPVQVLYLGVFFILAMVLYRKGVRNLNVNGG
jgi:ABC-2 type transport system permease protein